MRIIQVNKFNYLRGGAEKYFLELTESLQKSGHQVAVFSMQHPLNQSSKYAKYFPSRVSFNEGNIFQLVKASRRLLWSQEVARNFAKLIDDFKPEIIHIHNIYHHLSPSLLAVARKYKIPVVMHLHDHQLICPNHSGFVRNKVCNRCRGGKYYNCVRYRCVKNSFSKSLLASVAAYYHHDVLKIYRQSVSLFIAPSSYIKKQLIENGWGRGNIKVIRNFISGKLLRYKIKQTPGKYLLYFGRLSEEKGIALLIKALAHAPQSLKIVGRGPEEPALKALSRQLNLDKKISFVGFKNGLALEKIISEAKAVIVPSVCPENMPFSLLEAMALGKTVIAANIGGLPELIKDGRNGLLFKAGSTAALAASLKRLETTDTNKLGLAARASVKELSLKNHLQEIISEYRKLIKNKK